MAGGNHRGVRICPLTDDDREDSPEGIMADLEIIFIDEGQGAKANPREVIAGLGTARRVELRSIDQNEPDAEAAFDIERVPVNDPRHVPLDTQTDGSRAR